MKCITVKQPWATLLVAGETRYLVRDWRTFHRGALAIQASTRLPRSHVEQCCDPDLRAVLHRHGYDYALELPTGAVLGTVTLTDCFPLTDDSRGWLDPHDPAVVFGQAQPGRWVWVCADPQRFVRPVPLPGRLGIYTIPNAVLCGV